MHEVRSGTRPICRFCSGSSNDSLRLVKKTAFSTQSRETFARHDFPLPRGPLTPRRMTLYHLDRAALASCTALVAERDSAGTTIERMASRLLTAVSHPKAAACVKGRYFDRLDAKLNQLARFDSNELASVDLQAMATALFRRQKETV